MAFPTAKSVTVRFYCFKPTPVLGFDERNQGALATARSYPVASSSKRSMDKRFRVHPALFFIRKLRDYQEGFGFQSAIAIVLHRLVATTL
jgi:hypothetical protein